MAGAFIVIEGPDYVGKSTAVQAISERLTREHYPHVVCREPGGTPFSDAQRQLVLHSEQSPAPAAEVFAFLAAKAELLDKVIYPALREGKIVLCDRYTRSLLAYQGGIRGFAYDDLIRLLAHGRTLAMPHMEILLTASPDIRRQRRAARLNLDLMDKAGDDHADRLLKGYEDASGYLFAQRTVTFDTTFSDIHSTADQMLAEIHRYLKFHDITRPSFTPLTYAEWEERMADRHDRQETDPAIAVASQQAADGLAVQ